MRGVRAETELEELGVTVAKRQKWDGPDHSCALQKKDSKWGRLRRLLE